MEITKYNKEFTERTKKLLDEYYDKIEQEKGLEFTFLMNCLLGLIVITKEKANGQFATFLRNKLTDKEMEENIPHSVFGVDFKKSKKDLANTKQISFDVKNIREEINLAKFLNSLRNAIAHQNVDTIAENGTWERVVFYNVDNNHIRNFEVVFTQEELRKFALFLANKYLELNK